MASLPKNGVHLVLTVSVLCCLFHEPLCRLLRRRRVPWLGMLAVEGETEHSSMTLFQSMALAGSWTGVVRQEVMDADSAFR